ncbi:MAG TPA: TetR/AcrR family transcriptional regulator [Paenisporosarcina sp.]|nr:TetR/AcrR family transcriptional regulator [Paenisporosarcina sp.]
MKLEIDEKNERIFQVAKEQFALHGFHQTSTNLIAEQADVSKALIFHHFKSKKNLYLAIIEHSVELMQSSFEKEWHTDDTEDFFEMMKKLVSIKMTIAIKYPMDNKLLMQAFHSPPKEIVQELQLLIIEKSQAMQTLSDETIFSLLTPLSIREGVELEHAKNLIRIVFDSFAKRIVSEYDGRYEEMVNNTEEILADMDAIIDILKYGVYKK